MATEDYRGVNTASVTPPPFSVSKVDKDILRALPPHAKMIAIARTPLLNVSSGADAMSLLLTSERVYSDLLDWTRFGEPEQICLREWNPHLSLEYEFRVFVHDNNITAISQYDHYSYFPHLAAMESMLREGITELWRRIHSKLNVATYSVDIAYIPPLVDSEDAASVGQGQPRGSFVLVEFSPFFPCTGADIHTMMTQKSSSNFCGN